jgi:hypothetical protein
MSLAAVGTLALSACVVQPPPGPSFAAMPGDGKSYDQFRQDDARCQAAGRQAAGPVSPGQAATQSAVGSAVIGTALGAAAGAAIGSAAGAVGAGAAIGGGVGLLAGSAAGANNAQASAAGLQRAYDVAYAQCMAAAGEKVPDVNGGAAAYGGYPGYGYPAYAYGYPAYGYAYPAPYYGFYGPGVIYGGWGWGGGWHGGWGGGWHGGGYWHH